MLDSTKMIIQQGRAMTCPSCSTQSSFGISVPESTIKEGEIILTCPSCQWQYKLDEITAVGFVLPKRDPRLPMLKTTWLVETVGSITKDSRNKQWEEDSLYRPDGGASLEVGTDNATHDAAKIVSDVPPEIAVKSFPERMKETSALVLAVEHNILSMRRDMNFIKDAMLADVEVSKGILAGCMRNIDIEEFYQFFELPIFTLPIETQDQTLERYGRVLLTPKFYRGNHGIQLGSSVGWRMQVVCPYSMMSNPLERWLHEKMDIPPMVHLYPTRRKIYGNSLAYVWESIPGTEPSKDHQENSPSIQFTGDGSKARQWLAKHGCPAWQDVEIGGDMPSFKALACEHHPKLRHGFNRFFRHGRMLLSMESRIDMYYVASVMASCFNGSGVYITDESDGIHRFCEKRYKNSHLIKPVTRANWKLFANNQSAIEKHHLIIVDADSPWFHEMTDALYAYTDRLILLTSNPVFDMFQENSWAPVVYGLVNCSMYYLPNTVRPYSWLQNKAAIGRNLAMALEKVGMFDISKKE